ncbi:MAG TPA: BatD family protein [Verrucomicrobiae bacterium]|jgi:hypothetical protein
MVRALSNHYALLALLGIGLAWPVALAAATVTATLDRPTASVGESVTLTLTFEGASLPNAPGLPALTNLSLASVSQGSEFTVINGQATSRQNFSYTLTATKLGDATIPSMQFQVAGQALATPPLKLSIGAGAGDSALTNLAFLRLVVARTEVYLGEAFPIELHLYWQNAQDIHMPQIKADGFSLTQLPKPSQTRTQIGGVIYNLAMFKFAAAAAKAGNFTLGPAECSLTLQIPVSNPRRRDPFDVFGFGANFQLRPVILQSAAQPMRVLPLPKVGQPENFNGAVGNYTLSVTAGPTNLAVGDPITVKILISGQGRPESLTLPSQPQWREFTLYPPDTAFDSPDPLGLSGTKTFTQVVIPQNHEIKTLPAFVFSFFSPERKSYHTLSGPTVPLAIRPSAASTPSIALTNSNNGEPPPATDIVHIKPRLEMSAALPGSLLREPWFLALQTIPVAAWLGLMIQRKRRESLANNPRLRRQRQVAQFVRNGLRELQQHAAANKSDAFFATLFHLLQEQLGERLDLPASAITEAVIDERLRPRTVRPETLGALRELFQTCNLARYAPLKSSQELAALIPVVEKALHQLQSIKE